jgi:hypothetical protein
MKLLLAIFLSLPVSSSIAGECLKIEYQEMKEWTEDQLIKKFCEDKEDYDSHVAFANFLELSAKTSNGMGDIEGASKTWNKWSDASGSAKICKNEMERSVRLLAQRNLNEAVISARCPKKGGLVPELKHPKVEF